MKLDELLKNVEILDVKNISFQKLFSLEVERISDNSFDNLKNSLFVCISGDNFDSHKIVPEIDSFVKVFVCEHEVKTTKPYIIVKNTRRALSYICGNFYNNPIEKMKLVCVVGTNGKTTTTYFIKQMLESLGKTVGLIGTSGVYIKNKRLKETLTTPDPMLLHKLFYKMEKAKCDVVVMEVSAHAIFLHKTDNLKADVAIFTNFSQDHLDFFKTMENYKKTKLKFFENNTKFAIINKDDKISSELENLIKNKIDFSTFGLNSNANLTGKCECSINGTNLNIFYKNHDYFVKFNVPCLYNVYNLLSAVLLCLHFGFLIEEIINVISKIKNVLGRFDIIEYKTNKIIIDYAHTPESLKETLKNIKNLTNNEIILVFGCPGNRDETKREIMGKIANEYCKQVVITTDNPKFENPLRICNQILIGCKNKGLIIEDRFNAIKFAIKSARENEIILIAGKGSESFQDINGIEMKYSDYKSVFRCIKNRKNK